MFCSTFVRLGQVMCKARLGQERCKVRIGQVSVSLSHLSLCLSLCLSLSSLYLCLSLYNKNIFSQKLDRLDVEHNHFSHFLNCRNNYCRTSHQYPTIQKQQKRLARGQEKIIETSRPNELGIQRNSPKPSKGSEIYGSENFRLEIKATQSNDLSIKLLCSYLAKDPNIMKAKTFGWRSSVCRRRGEMACSAVPTRTALKGATPLLISFQSCNIKT